MKKKFRVTAVLLCFVLLSAVLFAGCKEEAPAVTTAEQTKESGQIGSGNPFSDGHRCGIRNEYRDHQCHLDKPDQLLEEHGHHGIPDRANEGRKR